MIRKFALLLSLSALFIACDRAPEIAGITGDTQVSDLSDEQAEQYCAYFDEQLKQVETDRAIQQGICMMFAVPVAQQMSEDHNERVVACRASLDECLSHIDEELQELSDESEQLCSIRDHRQDCDVSLSQLDTCVNAALDYLLRDVRGLADLGCPGLVDDEGPDKIEAAFLTFEQFGQDLPEIDECKVVREQCPVM